jgi:hypothetical protein
MVSTVKTRPSHYQVLGVDPRASDEDIARAFARQISSFQPRAFGGIAEVSIAYETLRDPARRSAYDESIGLKRGPERIAVPTAITFKVRQEWRAGSFVAPSKPPPEPQVVEAAQPAAPEPEVEIAEEVAEPSPPETEVAETAAIAPAPEPVEIVPRSRTDAWPSLERQFEALRSANWRETAASAIDWKRPAVIVGSLFLGAAAIGGFAGWKSVESIEPEAEAATVGRPAGTAKPAGAVPQVVPSATERASERSAERPVRIAQVQRKRQSAEEPGSEVPADSISEEIQVVDATATAAEAAQAAPAQVEQAAAAMPLGNRTIARTISRIGYSCGQVESTEPAGGAGVFKVTCTSGDSYRAAPVRGRYHFRRWSGQ